MKKQKFVTWIQTAIVHGKTDYIDKSISDDVGTKFDTSNYKTNRPLPKEKNKTVISVITK